MSHTEDNNPPTGSFLRQPQSEQDERAVDATAAYGHELGLAVSPVDREITPKEQEAISALPSGYALLIVRRGPNAGARFLLDSDVARVGRHPDADIFLDDVTVSRRHAEFRRSGTSFTLHDLNSLNGTFYAGERIDKAIELHDGAEVQVGKFRLTFYPSRQDLAVPGDA